jgi:hypothetical protein
MFSLPVATAESAEQYQRYVDAFEVMLQAVDNLVDGIGDLGGLPECPHAMPE